MSQLPSKDDPAPVAPVRPDNDDCCRSGCTPCVFDLYAEELERYKADLLAWQERQRNKPAPNKAAPSRGR